MVSKKIILFIDKSDSEFIRKDLLILKDNFSVKEFHCLRGNLLTIIISQLKLLFWLIKNIITSNVLFINFADYHSILPIFFGKIFSKRTILVVGGYEVAAIPGISYGALVNNYRGFFTLLALKHADFILPVSNYLAEKIKQKVKKIKGKIVVVNRGFVPAGNLPFSSKDSKLVLTVGNIFNWQRFKIKGLDFFIAIARKMPDFNFTIIGLAPSILNELAGQVPNNITLIGKKKNEELIPFYQKAKVYCQFSLIEGFPNVIGEAMVFGCIPVATGVGGTPEIMGNNGYLIKCDINQAIGSIGKAASAGEEKMKECQAWIIKNFSLEKRKEKLLELINS